MLNGFAVSLRIDYPMLFELHNPVTERTSHCGVLEFIAEEGMIYMPYWVCDNMMSRLFVSGFDTISQFPETYYVRFFSDDGKFGFKRG